MDIPKVVIVNGSPGILDMLDTALNAGQYSVVFVESTEHAYSQVKRVQPNLVILCVRMDEHEGFHVLSMLKLDGDTRNIPVLTFATGYEGRSPVGELVEERLDVDLFEPRPVALRMN